MRKRHKFEGTLTVNWVNGIPYLNVGEHEFEDEIFGWLEDQKLVEWNNRNGLVTTGLTMTVEIEVSDGT